MGEKNTSLDSIRISMQSPKIIEYPKHFFKNFPDYSSYKAPYIETCRHRYSNSVKAYNKQFLYELKMQETMQNTAYDAMRFHRHFAYTTLWPPLHSRNEIERVIYSMNKMTPKQDKRLKELLSQEIT